MRGRRDEARHWRYQRGNGIWQDRCRRKYHCEARSELPGVGTPAATARPVAGTTRSIPEPAYRADNLAHQTINIQ